MMACMTLYSYYKQKLHIQLLIINIQCDECVLSYFICDSSVLKLWRMFTDCLVENDRCSSSVFH